MIFVNTSAWFAIFHARDAASTAVVTWFNQNNQELITSDYVVDELLTLLRARGEGRRAIDAGCALFDGRMARIEYITVADVYAAWAMFQQYHDKEWSFTDCTSFVLIQRLEIFEAFAFDVHFSQFGKFIIVP